MLTAPSQPSGSANVPSVADSTPKITRGHSCVLCQQRKVKCDRQKPCSNCIKARAECVVAAPSQPRRRRRKLTESDLILRLRRYEHLLKSHGLKIECDDDIPAQTNRATSSAEEVDLYDISRLSLNAPRNQHGESGALFFGKAQSHYVENTLYDIIKEEVPIEEVETSSEDENYELEAIPAAENVLMSSLSHPTDLTSLHPPVVHIFRLWQIFLDNVNPLVKIFHAPTVQQLIIDASGNLKDISRPNEALMFAIYFLAILSSTPQDTENFFGESRQKLLNKYIRGVQQALVNARVLKTLNLTTLQAFILYLIGCRRLYDALTIWSLSGAAVRIAQRQGIHAQSGSQFSPFESEMRRRTWWQLVFLDVHASKLAGAPFPPWFTTFDSQLPLNISDGELSPSMKELPPSKEGITEMTVCAMRFETAQFLRNSAYIKFTNSDGSPREATPAELIAAKDKAIEELSQIYERKFLQYCDAAIPLQLLMIYMAKSALCTMRIMAHHPRNYPDKGTSMPQAEKDMLFRECLTEIEINTMGHEVKAVQGFMWHMYVYFQLDAFILLLSELQHRTSGDLVDHAWNQVERAYTQRPEMITDNKNTLWIAIGSLTLKAWTKREEAFNNYQLPTPKYISLLRAQRSRTPSSKSATQSPNQPQPPILYNTSNLDVNHQNGPPAPVHYPEQNILWGPTPADTSMGVGFDLQMNEISPTDWEYWQTLMDGELPTYVPDNSGQQWM